MSAQGNYFFQWEAISAAGLCEGVYEQTIYAEDLNDAASTFVAHHGSLAPNEDGVCLVIKNITWQPA